MTAHSSLYINEQRRNYSLYVMQMRAIPAATDGLKAGARRVLWMARDNKWHKANSLAAETTAIHPHDAPEGSVNTIAAHYGNNIPLLTGDGAFGTLLDNDAFGAARYTKVKTSQFTQDVVFRDIEIIPMMDNYDGTLLEPVHFLPLVPVALINPSSGIAVGFASTILPRSLEDIIMVQLQYLKGAKRLTVPLPKFTPTNNFASHVEEQANGNIAYFFEGEIEIVNASVVKVTNLPFGLDHEKFIAKLNDLIDREVVLDYDDYSKDSFNIEVKFKRGYLEGKKPSAILQVLGLIEKHVENLNVLDFEGKSVWNTNPLELICKFTDWRLKWYSKRYERLLQIAEEQLQRCLDIRQAIKKNVGKTARDVQSRKELIQYLLTIDIVNTDYIADLPVYRFTQSEYEKNEQKIEELSAEINEYQEILKQPDLRKKIYIKELEQVLKKYSTGEYDLKELVE